MAMMTKLRKYQNQEPKEDVSLIKSTQYRQNVGSAGEDGIKQQALDRRILFDVFFNGKKTGYLDYLIKVVPVFINLHQSFWENQQFLEWQLIRLNAEYQKSVEDIWHDRWTRAGITEQQQIEKYFFDFRDCIPGKVATYQTWESAGWLEEDKNGKRRFGIEVAKLKAMWKVDFPPIPWIFRFTARGYLDQLPLISGYGSVRLKRGHPIKDWAKNLLVYELSEAGMKNMEIARLVFGVEKSTENWPAEPKHPILVKISKVKKTMKKIISESYLSI
jgi:hypothetical protein